MANRRKNNKAKEKESDWQERVVQIRRVTKVVKGGKPLVSAPLLSSVMNAAKSELALAKLVMSLGRLKRV